MAFLVQTMRTGGRGIRKAVMDALPTRPIKLSETYSNGFHRRYKEVQRGAESHGGKYAVRFRQNPAGQMKCRGA